jgi:hypothetical protein
VGTLWAALLLLLAPWDAPLLLLLLLVSLSAASSCILNHSCKRQRRLAKCM